MAIQDTEVNTMINEGEIKREVDVKLTKVGNSIGLILPQWFLNQWQIRPDSCLKIMRLGDRQMPLIQYMGG